MDTDDTLSRWLDDAAEETANHHALLALLAETSRVLGADLDLPTLLVKLMALAEKMVGAEASSVMLLDERRATPHWEVAEGDVTAGALRQMTVAVGEGIAGTVAATGESIVVPDAEQDPRVARRVDAATGFRTRSIVCVPIRFRGSGDRRHPGAQQARRDVRDPGPRSPRADRGGSRAWPSRTPACTPRWTSGCGSAPPS